MSTQTVTVLTFLFWHSTSFCQPGTPPVEEIASKFYNSYNTQATNEHYSFEKRPGQWTVRVEKWQNNQLTPAAGYLFFDADSGGYQHLPLPAKEDSTAVDFRQYLDAYSIANFGMQPFYGYAGWYKDVIGALSKQSQLTDTALNGLARAYSTYASCLLADQTGDAVTADLFNLPLRRNCMTPAQIAQYHQIESMAIQTFDRLRHQNPDFETIVGKMPIKYANEVMVEFHTYLTFADSLAATLALPDHLFPDSLIAKAKRVLTKCPREAILLSLGDNDFYPILYLQQKRHIRTDVRLINLNLLGLDRFIYAAGQPQFQSKAVPLSVTAEQYEGNRNDYLYLNDGRVALPFSALVDTLLTGHRGEYGALTVPAREFILHRWTGNAGKSDTLHVPWQTGYIVKQDWVLLDILNNLHGRKLACQTLLYDELAPLNAYFIQTDDDLFVY